MSIWCGSRGDTCESSCQTFSLLNRKSSTVSGAFDKLHSPKIESSIISLIWTSREICRFEIPINSRINLGQWNSRSFGISLEIFSLNLLWGFGTFRLTCIHLYCGTFCCCWDCCCCWFCKVGDVDCVGWMPLGECIAWLICCCCDAKLFADIVAMFNWFERFPELSTEYPWPCPWCQGLPPVPWWCNVVCPLAMIISSL